MKKLIPILLLVIIFPVAAHAAWWNPSDWFTTKPAPTAPILPVTDQDIPTNEDADVTPTTTTQTEYVTDPSLEAEIFDLQTQNATLQHQLTVSQQLATSVTASLNQCRATPATVSAPAVTASNSCSVEIAKREQMYTDKNTATAQMKTAIAEVDKNPTGMFGGAVKEEEYRVGDPFQEKIGQLSASIESENKIISTICSQ